MSFLPVRTRIVVDPRDIHENDLPITVHPDCKAEPSELLRDSEMTDTKISVSGALQWPATLSAPFLSGSISSHSTKKDVANVERLLDARETLWFYNSNEDVGVS